MNGSIQFSSTVKRVWILAAKNKIGAWCYQYFIDNGRFIQWLLFRIWPLRIILLADSLVSNFENTMQANPSN